jgi:hypothetical protein
MAKTDAARPRDSRGQKAAPESATDDAEASLREFVYEVVEEVMVGARHAVPA